MDKTEALALIRRRISACNESGKESKLKAAEALTIAAEALEKQIPKKPVRIIVDSGFNRPMPKYIDACPCCGVDMLCIRDLKFREFWCPDCGQAIDWSGEE